MLETQRNAWTVKIKAVQEEKQVTMINDHDDDDDDDDTDCTGGA